VRPLSWPGDLPYRVHRHGLRQAGCWLYGQTSVKLSTKEVKTIRALLKTAYIPIAEIAARFGISRSTLYRTILRPAA
jgi:DNA invertase Pin-like site-specific DNA recombinase